ncbi:pyruvate carboxylase [Desulfoferrobacter suflitae]|uniref:pyruvate carboxylase n=1 Tax=Desulfoferrobacter suflitae TaxID=2865782 RepID=UPI0021648810|nr:pyruvate carboxylase [Desulfoferrobacter suflitae]MCK8602500.1 pyruvate carboxylase [Desulfoferrobacter suflitae]
MSQRERITPKMKSREVLDFLHSSPGYFLTNNERDVSQSDFKGRIMPHTTLKVAPYRDESGYFAFEISGGASVHVDLLRKQINPFEKLRLIRKAMPNTLLQAVCRGRNLFGYRPYPDNVIRQAVRLFSRYVDVWRVYDFLNHIPNLKVVAEEVQKAGKILMPSICFSTGRGHTDEFYLGKVEEILSTVGEDVILGIKNHSAVGSPARIASLVRALRDSFPGLLLSYHGHNTDGNDLSRMIAAVTEGVKIVEVADHGYGGMFSQAPALSLIQSLHDYGIKSPCLKVHPLVEASDILRRERRLYERFETPYRGFDPTVKRHKLTGGAASMAFEQAEKLGLLERVHEVFDDLSKVNIELGNIWSVTPGSQILWTTAVNNVLHGRYEKPSDDLKRLLLGRYGPFPFYDPQEWIYEKVLEYQRTDGKKWYQILDDEAGIQQLAEENFDAKRQQLERELKRSATEEELCLYVQFPRDALEYFRFEEQFGKTWLLPPDVWFKRGGFEDGTRITLPDYDGKTHYIDLVSTRRSGDVAHTSLLVDYHFQTYSTALRTKKLQP